MNPPVGHCAWVVVVIANKQRVNSRDMARERRAGFLLRMVEGAWR